MSSKILIVEDEFIIAAAMEDAIRDLGHEPAGIVDDMKSALQVASRDIDVALVDVNLADGATGPLIGKQLATDFGIEVIFVTANPQQLGAGVEGTLGAVEKPIEVSVLPQLLDYVIALRRGEPANPPPNLKLFKS